ncbi:MAG TPA: hypothetical protein VFA16_15845 [Mycobacterium sp.]|uniref:hypothetical protein n=1 Tax=Mycobacterium sp. TaxID=1785 RepID=UPI002D4275D7|nr:hypothetical protein [Mycobacterium sp.]HZU48701.1 hypothetical protein [Mycobacterium sp.]
MQTELAGLSDADDHTWLAPVALALARGLDDPEAQPYYAELAAELVKALVRLYGGNDSPDYRPRLTLIRGDDKSQPERGEGE